MKINPGKIIPFALTVLLPFLWQSCTQPEHPGIQNADYNIDMSFPQKMYSKKGDSLFVYFKVIDKKSNRKVKIQELDNYQDAEKLIITEVGNGAKQIPERCKITTIDQIGGNQQDLVSKNSIFWLLIDRSNIPQDQLDIIKEAVAQTLVKLPDSTVYLSFVDKLDPILITRENFNEINENEFNSRQQKKKLLCSAIIKQFSNFAKDTMGEDKDCFLLVCTDGKFQFFDDRETIQHIDSLVKNIDIAIPNRISIEIFRYGRDTTNDVNLTFIPYSRDNTLKGRLYSVEDAGAVSDTMASFITNELSYDYLLTYVRSFDNDYIGQPLSLSVYIQTKDGKKLYGEIENYKLGSPTNPISGSPVNFWLSVFLSIVIIIIIYFIIQVGIPYVISKRENFKEKYVKPYEYIEKVQMECCTWCGEPFEEGDEVVEKCQHKSHYNPCWQERGHHCIEYGRYCKDGIEHYFDKKHAFDLKTGPFYRKWAMAGAISGLIISIFDYCFLKFVPAFKNLSGFMVNTIYLKSNYKEIIVGREKTMGIPGFETFSFCNKITGFLMAGILLGFTLTFLFSWINEFRSKKGRVFWSILLRSLLGAAAGFTAFFIGSAICILIGDKGSGMTPYIDWIPWILFGLGIALCLSVKTTIKMKDAVVGGLISGAVSFVCLFSSYIFSPFGMFLSFMLCSAGIGISIVAKHYTAQKYFLKYTHKNKSGEIAIHKWMSESGGRNEVTIGKSVHSVIQINWADKDEEAKIHDIQANLYIDKKHNRPCITALEEGMQLDGRDAKVNVPNLLENGKTFLIGETKFEYIEK